MNSQENEKFEFFCQETCNFQNLGNETLFIADYKYVHVRKSAFGWLTAKAIAQRNYLVESLHF